MRRLIFKGTILAALALLGLAAAPVRAGAASGQVSLPLPHRLQGILVDIYVPGFIFGIGHDKAGRGFVATRDGLVLAPLKGLEKLDLGGDVKLEWMDKRSAEGWVVWKDEEARFVIIRLLEPMPLFPALRWREGPGPKAGELLIAPAPPQGGQPAVSRTLVVSRRDLALPLGRFLQGALLLSPSLSTGPISGPLLDESGELVGMVTDLEAPPGADAGTVVAIPVSAVEPDLKAARAMRPPLEYNQPSVMPRPSYGSVGIGIGSGGVYPRFGVGVGGLGVRPRGSYGTLGPRDRWDQTYDPSLRHEQEYSDRAKTEALERALAAQESEKALGQPGGGAPLTNSETLASSGPEAGAPGGAEESWRAGPAAVSSAPLTGGVRQPAPQTQTSPPTPQIGSTWNPSGQPLTPSPPAPSGGQSGSWPVVLEPEVPEPLRKEQRETDRAATEKLDKELAASGAGGQPEGASQGEMTILTTRQPSPPASGPPAASASPELSAIQERNRALEAELEELRRNVDEGER